MKNVTIYNLTLIIIISFINIGTIASQNIAAKFDVNAGRAFQINDDSTVGVMGNKTTGIWTDPINGLTSNFVVHSGGDYMFWCSSNYWIFGNPGSQADFFIASGPNHNSIASTEDLYIGTENHPQGMIFSTNGNIGINNQDPKSKLHVTSGDVYIENIGTGVIMKSPDGNCWRYTPDNSGVLQPTMITCPN